ncbi:hypothetical protein J2Z17_000714 [Rhizobium halophytocola]|uniref:IS110 family transposase n=1 Tax=Rhizobium halophytocola TaxID=735519 RepID=A0ABS4DUB5_9HYPH|nr:hypothetical protein [Rhizobium halophytocola]
MDLKSQEQLDIQTLHRVRSRLVAERTTLINQLRAVLLERGVVFAAGRVKFENGLDKLIAGDNDVLSPRIRSLILELRDEWRRLDEKIETLTTEFVALAKHNSAMRRLTSIPGIGVLNATALVAAIGDASSFGLGGCPYAPGAKGNVDTMKVQVLMERLGFETGLRTEGLEAANASTLATRPRDATAFIHGRAPGDIGQLDEAVISVPGPASGMKLRRKRCFFAVTGALTLPNGDLSVPAP